ncbi:type I-C CRISPR-associated protein Cas8c/Csd1 [Luteolibacter algae]|uniref:Type I-C CRISPR-associated protein Cas8c/Csd1 n=1 Tax=Luteolibacter algae TaxID=454151 RepID=A0ABW5D6D3_9BACT
MILQKLNQFYERIQGEDGNPYGVPTPGYSVQNITFRIVLNPDGSLVEIQDTRKTLTQTTKTGKIKTKQVPRQTLVPGDSKPPGQGINPCTFWDNTAYLLGYKKPDKNSAKAEKEAARALETLAATKEHYIALSDAAGSDQPALAAIRSFYENHWNAEMAVDHAEKLDDFAATGFGVFRVLPSQKDVHEQDAIKAWWATRQHGNTPTDDLGFCLVTGQELPIARIHEPAIKGVNGAAPGGAKLASFEKHSFRSYAKDQSFNSPVSEQAVFAYCNALNALLSGPQSHRHLVTIGDVTTIFWTEKKSTTESLFAHLLGGNIEAEPASTNTEDQIRHNQLQVFLDILRKGGGASVTDLDDKPDTKFYILGLSGNVTRLVVRFWHVNTIDDMIDRLRDHYQNLALTRKKDSHPYREPEFPSAQRLLEQTARDRKAISPLLGGQLMQAILNGSPYPMTLLQGVLNRLKIVEKDPQGKTLENVTYLKAAILKAVLIRNFNQTIDMSLNTERTEPAYLLGRLFAALEKTQQDALGQVNAGIRERFYSSASATPGSVFPRIMRTYTHHLAKMGSGALAERIGSEKATKAKIGREILIQEIHTPLEGYPTHLNLEEQGLFAIGYYHQRQDFFTKKTSDSPESQNPQ